VLGLTVFIPFWAATDEPPLPWLLGLDAVLIVLSLLMTSVSRTINRHVDRLSLRQELGRPSEHVA
jgi:hypothetical protein